MRTLALAAAVLAAAVTAGCGEADPEYRLTGGFTETATQEEIAELREYVAARGGDLAVLESFPPQFVANGLGREACEDVRGFAAARDYVSDVGECFVPDVATDPEEPTSATPGDT